MTINKAAAVVMPSATPKIIFIMFAKFYFYLNGAIATETQ